MNSRKENGSAGPALVDVDTSSQHEAAEPDEQNDRNVDENEQETAVEPVAETEPADPISELEKELEAVRDLARRKQAEFENYRKRVERERADMATYASVDVVSELLPVLDNLERAIIASEAGSEDNFREGVQIIHKQFSDVLGKQGLKEIEALNQPFDPHFHEAVGRVETDEQPDGTVLEIFQKGYRLKDRLIRAAMVTVSVGTEPSSDDEDDEAQADTSGTSEQNGQDDD